MYAKTFCKKWKDQLYYNYINQIAFCEKCRKKEYAEQLKEK